MDDERALFLRQWDIRGDEAGGDEEAGPAGMVTAEPDRHDRRVVDVVPDRLLCRDRDDRPGRGPAGCFACEPAHGFRCAATELLARRLLLPALLAGQRVRPSRSSSAVQCRSVDSAS